tara:strand:+ start:168 stop:527 length:360 start_codon:yes stop_codon:yes gene_type:complete
MNQHYEENLDGITQSEIYSILEYIEKKKKIYKTSLTLYFPLKDVEFNSISWPNQDVPVKRISINMEVMARLGLVTPQMIPPPTEYLIDPTYAHVLSDIGKAWMQTVDTLFEQEGDQNDQ